MQIEIEKDAATVEDVQKAPYALLAKDVKMGGAEFRKQRYKQK